jgi:hypothetical protein
VSISGNKKNPILMLLALTTQDSGLMMMVVERVGVEGRMELFREKQS